MKDDKNLLLTKRNKLSFLTQSIHESISEKGVLTTLKKIFKHIMYKIKGIDFAEEELNKLTIESKNKSLATIYGSSGDEAVKLFLDTVLKLDSTVLNGTFVDYGSGKGMAIIYAKKYGFKKAIGVEFAKELCDITKVNIKKMNLKQIEVFHMDAINFTPKNDTRVIYFLNPFHETILKQVLSEILKNKKNFLHDIYLIYNIPVYQKAFQEFKLITTCTYGEAKAHIYKLEVQ